MEQTSIGHTLVSLLERRAAEAPHAVAASDSEQRLTWEELENASRSVAAGLGGLGLEPGEPVLVQLPNWVENLVLRYALKRAKLLGVYLPVSWREQEVRQVVERTEARLFVAPESFRGLDYCRMSAHLSELFPRLDTRFVRSERSGLPKGSGGVGAGFEPADLSLISVSSGSTGAPKLCEATERAQIANARSMADRLGVSSSDVVGIFAPLDGGAGLMGWLLAAAAGARIALADDFQPKAMLDTLARERVSVLATVPALLIRLLEIEDVSKWDLSALRMIRTGTAALLAPTAFAAERRFGAKMVPAAGTMEALTYAQTGPNDSEDVRLGRSVGKPLAGNEVRVVTDEGRELAPGEMGILEVRGPGTGTGYYRDPDATAVAWRDGWFRTGDLAVIDALGNVFLRGRTKDVIARGGRSIYPVELESLLMEHPGVREVAVVGVSCEALEQRTCACVVVREDDVTEEELRDFLESKRIATYKMPDEFRFLSDLPRLPGAKVNRRALSTEGSRP